MNRVGLGLAVLCGGLVGLLATPRPWLEIEAFAARRVGVERDRAQHAERVLRSPAARVFWGAEAQGDPDAACLELRRAALQLRLDPPPTLGTTIEFLRYLEDGHAPSLGGSPFWRATLGGVERTTAWLLAQPQPVSSGQLLLASAESAGGAALGVLTAHNLVKELAFQGRRADPERIPPIRARLAAALSPWRRAPALPAGGFDRLGPVYHALATLTLVTWTGSPAWGARAADYEALRRIARIGRDRPDPVKAQADRCGVAAGVDLLPRG